MQQTAQQNQGIKGNEVTPGKERDDSQICSLNQQIKTADNLKRVFITNSLSLDTSNFFLWPLQTNVLGTDKI